MKASSKKDHTATLARMAGNIAAGIITADNLDVEALMKEPIQKLITKVSVDLAAKILDEAIETEETLYEVREAVK